MRSRSGDLPPPPPSVVPGQLTTRDVVNVWTDVGPLFVHRHDAVMRPTLQAEGRWEPDEGAFLRAQLHPGSVFLDVGANIGYMTLLGARVCGPTGRTIAIEPEPGNLELLRANLWRNGARAWIVPAAAYSRHGFLYLVRNERNPGDHQVNQIGGESLVPCVRLDDHLGGVHVDVAKVDTQGTDHEVVAGMSGLLSRNPALLMLVEFSLENMRPREVDPMEVLSNYRSAGYRLGLLVKDGRDGESHEATDAEIIAGCEGWPGLYVNLVLAGPQAPLPAGWQKSPAQLRRKAASRRPAPRASKRR